MMMGSDSLNGMWVLMAVGMFIGLSVLVLAAVTVAMKTGAPAKRKRGMYDPDIYPFFDEKPKHGMNDVFADDGEIVEVVDDWQTHEMAENS
jgi:hypothetical protein